MKKVRLSNQAPLSTEARGLQTADLDEHVREWYCGRRILVTGGAGFIGSHIVEMLVSAAANVTVPVRATSDLSYLDAVRDRVRLLEADLSRRTDVDRAVEGHDIVVHMAAAKGGGIAHSMAHHGSLFRDNMLSGIHVLDAAREHGVDRLLLVSSACVYPRDAVVPTPEEEGFRAAPEPTNAGYGWSKRMLEFMALAYIDEFGVDFGVARPFNAYGPRDDFFRPANHVIPGIMTRLLDGENPLVVWGSGRQTRSFLYVTDFARGVLTAAAAEGVRGPINLGSDEEVTIAELARLIVEVSGLDVDVVMDPSKPDGQPRRACDTTRARETLGFRATVPLREGLDRTMRWFRRERRRRGIDAGSGAAEDAVATVATGAGTLEVARTDGGQDA